MTFPPQRTSKALPYILITIGTVLVLVASQAVVSPVAQILLSGGVLLCAFLIRKKMVTCPAF